MLKKIVLLGLIVGIGAVSVPAFAAGAIAGAVGNVSAADGALLGQIGSRTWSLSDPQVNANTGGACLNTRCPASYLTTATLQPGGYRSASENTVIYASDADNQTFYTLYDGEINAGSSNHVAFYAIQGLVASNGTVTNPLGAPVSQGCPGTASQNCMERADTRFSRATPLLGTAANFGGGPGAFSVRSIGGFSPVPHVKTTVGGACPAGSVCLSWDEPESYAGAMKANVGNPAPPSPSRASGSTRSRTAAPTPRRAPPRGSPLEPSRWALARLALRTRFRLRAPARGTPSPSVWLVPVAEPTSSRPAGLEPPASSA